MNRQTLADNARDYCQTMQNREFRLDGACHENVIGAADYVRLQTSHEPLIVWGVVSHAPEQAPDNIQAVSEVKTHFWVELEDADGIVDVYTNNPLVGDNSQYVDSGIAYGGVKPDCYGTVAKYRYFGSVTPLDLASKGNFQMAVETKPIEPQ